MRPSDGKGRSLRWHRDVALPLGALNLKPARPLPVRLARCAHPVGAQQGGNLNRRLACESRIRSRKQRGGGDPPKRRHHPLPGTGLFTDTHGNMALSPSDSGPTVPPSQAQAATGTVVASPAIRRTGQIPVDASAPGPGPQCCGFRGLRVFFPGSVPVTVGQWHRPMVLSSGVTLF